MTRHHHLLSVPALAVALAVVPGAVTAPAWADPPEVVTGDFAVTAFTITPGETTGQVSRFSFDLTAVTTGDLVGTFTEHQDCMRVGEVIRCQGTATTVGSDGSTGTVRSRLTCTLALVCEGRAQGRGTGPDGERQIWMTRVTTAGDGTGSYVTRIVQE